MSANDISINFDQESDIVYVVKKGVSKSSIQNIEARAGFVFKLNIKTKEVVGFIIHNVSQQMPWLLQKEEYYMMEEFESLLQTVNDYHRITQAA